VDGFDVLVKTPMWAALQRANDAAFDLQRSMEKNGFAGDFAYAARLKLGEVENQLRHHFKRATSDDKRGLSSGDSRQER
jgi:hypothetical protein